jgi:hypothetical protein
MRLRGGLRGYCGFAMGMRDGDTAWVQRWGRGRRHGVDGGGGVRCGVVWCGSDGKSGDGGKLGIGL